MAINYECDRCGERVASSSSFRILSIIGPPSSLEKRFELCARCAEHLIQEAQTAPAQFRKASA